MQKSQIDDEETIAKIAKTAKIAKRNPVVPDGAPCAVHRSMTNPSDLKTRSRMFALRVIRLVKRFPRTLEGQIVARQLVRAATGTAANYRAACRSRSRAEFIARIGIAAEEADESQLWFDLAEAVPIFDEPDTKNLLKEAAELTAIFTTSRNTAKANLQKGLKRN